MTTVRFGSPPGVSAITFTLSPSCSRTSVLTRATVPGSVRSTPTSKLVPTPGMWTPSAPSGRLLGTAVRPGWPSLNRMIAEAPASWAMAAFWTYGHVPRWSRAMLPGTKPAKSSTSQPLVDVFGAGPGGSTRSTPWTGAVTSPLPVNDTKSPSNAGRDPGHEDLRLGRGLLEHRGRALAERLDVGELVEGDVVTGGLGLLDDVVHGGVVARRAGRTVSLRWRRRSAGAPAGAPGSPRPSPPCGIPGSR